MRMDWAKANNVSGVGTFGLTVAVVVLMVWPLLRPTTPPSSDDAVASVNSASTSASGMTGWGPPVLLGVCLLVAAGLHLKASRSQQRQADTRGVAGGAKDNQLVAS